ncbi:MAG: hypothetical protein RJB13_92 [Pseudomonadota bacterium]
MIKTNTATFVALTLVVIACKPRTFNSATVQSLNPADFQKQFESTKFSECVDAQGKSAGSMNFVWRVKKSDGQTVIPYILGFSGNLISVSGQKIEFRSVSTIDEPRYRTPTLRNGESFPVPQYFAASLQFPSDELNAGWGYFRVNGADQKIDEVYGGTLVIPKYADGPKFERRYFIVGSDGQSHEFNCAPISADVKARMKTYLVNDGSHGFRGGRGTVVVGEGSSKTDTDDSTLNSGLDLRPEKRTPSYDVQFRHERIYECGKNGAIDVIWRRAESNGQALPAQSQYILGLAAQLSDEESRSIRFSSVTIDSAPAFSAGSEPSPKSYLRPMFEFDASEVQQGLAYHSIIPGLEGRSLASGGTLWIPYDGSGTSVSVAIALGRTVRGSAFQVIADCTPKSQSINRMLTSCVGRASVDSSGTCQF